MVRDSFQFHRLLFLKKPPVAGVVFWLVLLGLLTGAEAVYYSVPGEPISPTNLQECYALREDYKALDAQFDREFNRLKNEKANAYRNRCDRVFSSGTTRWSACYREVGEYYRSAIDQVFAQRHQVSMEGINAGNRCRKRVAEHERNQRAQRSSQTGGRMTNQEYHAPVSQGQRKSLPIPSDVAMNLGKALYFPPLEVARDSFVEKMFPNLNGVYQHLQKLNNNLNKVSNALNLAKNYYAILSGERPVTNPNELAGTMNLSGSVFLSSYPLSKALFEIMMPAIVGIQGNAMAQFEQEMNQLNASSFEAQMAEMSAAKHSQASSSLEEPDYDQEFSSLRAEDEQIQRDYALREEQAKQQQLVVEERRRQERVAREQRERATSSNDDFKGLNFEGNDFEKSLPGGNPYRQR